MYEILPFINKKKRGGMGKIIYKIHKKIFGFIIVNKIKCYFGVISKTEKNQCKLKTAPLPQKSTCMTFFLK